MPREPPVTSAVRPARSNTALRRLDARRARDQPAGLVDRRHPPPQRLDECARVRYKFRVRPCEHTTAEIDAVLEADADAARAAEEAEVKQPPLLPPHRPHPPV